MNHDEIITKHAQLQQRIADLKMQEEIAEMEKYIQKLEKRVR